MVGLKTDHGLGKFVQEEWEIYFADGAARQVIDVEGGWRGEKFVYPLHSRS